ncbi:MAG: winged helix-turn-helix transcriptional regulator [Deltaproteobacteria bacterium]|nr:winged helix-turn-helix transcriptional regulator [Deltaproteobacteria bacterium]MBW2312030.1 winged helix-turn-helix transcriptional regulator [Deltaproteobacteria bacterium]
MDPQDIRSLQILEEIENNYSPSQRDLARKLNISLGLVNSFMKRLAKKGYVKITTVPKNRVKYMLTPKGFGEKSRLTYEFIQYSFRFYKKALSDLEDMLDEFERTGVKRVAFYGANDLAEIAFITLKATSIKLVGVGDDSRKGKTFLGYTIKSIAELRKLAFDKVIITAIESRKEIYRKLLVRRIPEEKIVLLD